jgi:betaine-aldehyde dehydrogenase
MDIREQLYIGGEWVAPDGTETIEVISPHSEEVIARVPHASVADVDRAVAAARQAFDEGPWPQTTPAERADVMAAISAGVTARSEEMAQAISAANGSPISWSRMGQILASTMVLDFYTELARTYAFEDVRDGLLGPTVVRREPVGVAGAITPWNVPLFTIMLKMGPALAAGCTMVVKPAPETPIDAFQLAEICDEAGLPPGVFNIVPAGREVGEHLVTHPDVDKIGFTGSSTAGRHIGALCAERLARFTLELGGKSAAILLGDADLATAIPSLIGASIMNNGQACVAQTRVLAPRDRYQEVVDGLVDQFRDQVVGDPLDEATTVGPLVAKRQQDRVLGYIQTGQDEGAKVAVGGGRPASLEKGWYVEPTLFVDVDNTMTIAREEIFGPVVAVIPYDGVDDAVRLANESDYGLSGSVWGPDAGECLDIARRIRTGTVSINGFILDFGSPFGGYKQSGLGRELGPEGLEAYLESKSISLIGETEVPGA